MLLKVFMKEDKGKIAVFDFCETLANYQTADPFVHFVVERIGFNRVKRKEKVLAFFNRIRIIPLIHQFFPSLSINKKLTLRLLKGLPEEQVKQLGQEYYIEVVKKRLINKTITLLQEKQEDGYDIILASGGYNLYLYHIEPFNVFCSIIQFKNGLCTGRLDGKDCMGVEKVRVLNNHLNRKEVYVEAFSDSLSDLPLLQWADRSYLIEKVNKKHNYNINIETIIWEE